MCTAGGGTSRAGRRRVATSSGSTRLGRVLSVSEMRSLLVVIFLLAAMSRASAQPAPDVPIDAATRSKVIEGALAALTRYYVYPDVAAKIRTEVRRRVAAKKYDGVTRGRALAELLTSDLRSVNHDQHLAVEFTVEPAPDRKG